MPYAQTTDLQARYSNRDLTQLTTSDISAVGPDLAVLAQALADASVEIDSYLEARFTLPLSDPPAALNRLCCDIAIYRLQALTPLHDLEDARKRYEDAIKFLAQVNQGKLTLGLSADALEPPAAQAEAAVVGTNRSRVFTRGALHEY